MVPGGYILGCWTQDSQDRGKEKFLKKNTHREPYLLSPRDPITLSQDEQGMYNQLLSKLYKFPYHSQKAMGFSRGVTPELKKQLLGVWLIFSKDSHSEIKKSHHSTGSCPQKEQPTTTAAFLL